MEETNILKLLNKYGNINNLDLSGCKIINDIISKLENLEILNVSSSNISDISF